MKGKKFNFPNTGYGKSKHHTHTSRCPSFGVHKETNPKEPKKILEPNNDDMPDDKDLNSGFGDYLRTPDAVEMMKLFVFANSIMLILTMAWPNLKDHYYMLMHWLNSFQVL